MAPPVQPTLEMEPRGYGIHGTIGGTVTADLAMGGVHGSFRFRPNMGHFALDLGIGAYGGMDYNGLERVEVPLTADALVYVNPRQRFQIYGVAGLGLSFAHAEGFQGGDFLQRDYAHFGAQLGAGAELRLSRWFSVNADVRGFVRERIDNNPTPEFTEIDVDGDLRSTDTSGGVLVNIGGTVYF